MRGRGIPCQMQSAFHRHGECIHVAHRVRFPRHAGFHEVRRAADAHSTRRRAAHTPSPRSRRAPTSLPRRTEARGRPPPRSSIGHLRLVLEAGEVDGHPLHASPPPAARPRGPPSPRAPPGRRGPGPATAGRHGSSPPGASSAMNFPTKRRIVASGASPSSSRRRPLVYPCRPLSEPRVVDEVRHEEHPLWTRSVVEVVLPSPLAHDEVGVEARDEGAVEPTSFATRNGRLRGVRSWESPRMSKGVPVRQHARHGLPVAPVVPPGDEECVEPLARNDLRYRGRAASPEGAHVWLLRRVHQRTRSRTPQGAARPTRRLRRSQHPPAPAPSADVRSRPSSLTLPRVPDTGGLVLDRVGGQNAEAHHVDASNRPLTTSSKNAVCRRVIARAV